MFLPISMRIATRLQKIRLRPGGRPLAASHHDCELHRCQQNHQQRRRFGLARTATDFMSERLRQTIKDAAVNSLQGGLDDDTVWVSTDFSDEQVSQGLDGNEELMRLLEQISIRSAIFAVYPSPFD